MRGRQRFKPYSTSNLPNLITGIKVMSLSTTSNQQLTYKELQQAIKSYKEQGLTGIKLNSKHCVLQEEYERITNATVKDEQPVTNSATASNYPFCSNTVKVENKPGVTAVKPTVERSETTVNERSAASVLNVKCFDVS